VAEYGTPVVVCSDRRHTIDAKVIMTRDSWEAFSGAIDVSRELESVEGELLSMAQWLRSCVCRPFALLDFSA